MSSSNMTAPETPLKTPNDLDAFWIPFTPNRHFKAHPRILSSASGMYYVDQSGRKVLDGIAGLWCVNAGHSPKPIAEAIARQVHELDFAPCFQFAHPKAFELATRIAGLAPDGLEHVFFVNSGSEAAETALKIARAYFAGTGEGGRYRLIGRERSYHGVNFGGISVGGIGNNRKAFGPLLPGTDDHLPLPYKHVADSFTKGEYKFDDSYAEELERIVALHGASTIAAVIVEPMTGSGGVFPTRRGYLQLLREICDKYGILLIFDEVITGFGRMGHGFAAERYGVVPDMICFAKGVTNGTIPLGGVVLSEKIYQSFLQEADHGIDIFHGHTYTGHPMAMAAGLATLDYYRDETLFERATAMEPVLADAVHALERDPHVHDIRSVGMAAAIELRPAKGAPGKRGFEAMVNCFEEENLVVRLSGDTLVLSPALIASEDEIGRMAEAIHAVLARMPENT
jgi:beta-alanine--pyruvate transaminase